MTSFARTAQGLAIATLIAAAQPMPPAEAQNGDGRRSGGSFYAGAHVGYMFGTANATLSDPIGINSQSASNPYGALFGGVQAGWEYVFPSRLMLGIEADFSFPNYEDASKVLSYRATPTGYASEEYEWLASLRGRLGYDIGAWTPYLTGGIAWMSTRYSRIDLNTGNEDGNPSNIRVGWTAGAGLDWRLDSRWSARAEYLYTNLGLTGFTFGSAPARYDSQYDLHRFRVGLNYKFGATDDKADREPDSGGPGSWELHGQTTFIYQGYPPFSASYEGPNSLPMLGQSRETWTVSAFLGVRLWQGGEFYYNPELLQGFGVANATGAAGYPNGEAQKSNFPYPRYNTSRLFLRQEIGLGGETETVPSEYGQLSGTKDVSRVTFQLGKFSVHDLFDGNDYAEDPRVDFLNWSIWASGAFDYPADRLGLTWGFVAELNQPRWAARAGYFLVGNQPNANTFDLNLLTRGGYVGELELRFRPYDRPGVLRFGSWLTSTFAGSYEQAVLLAASNPGLDANDTIAWTRQTRTKYGFYLNLQQQLTDDIGLFGRFSWNDGRTEIGAFTDIDTSASLGLSIKGTRWGRPDDRVGIAGSINQISGAHSGYLAAGGLGVLVGDGQLPIYSSENVFETYYALHVAKDVTATGDYQFLGNPAYNAQRGPVHVFSGRLSARF